MVQSEEERRDQRNWTNFHHASVDELTFFLTASSSLSDDEKRHFQMRNSDYSISIHGGSCIL